MIPENSSRTLIGTEKDRQIKQLLSLLPLETFWVLTAAVMGTEIRTSEDWHRYCYNNSYIYSSLD